MSNTWFEPLEPKRLFSAVVKNGILSITGTEHADTINFWFGEKNPLHIIVRDGVDEFSFPRTGIRLIRVHGLGGDDHISPLNRSGEVNINISADGGAGDDQITGGSGDDTLIGGDGNDDLRGGTGFDYADYRYVDTTFQPVNSGQQYGLIMTMDGQTNDRTADGTDNEQVDIESVFGTRFRDSISCSGIANTVFGGNGPDNIYGSAGRDLLDGGNGANFLSGGSQADTLVGGDGASTLEGDGGNDSLRGGAGDETLAGGPGSDRYNGGAGFDTADFTGDKRSFHLSFDGKFNDGPGVEHDDFIEIDHVLTTSNSNRVDASALSHGIVFKTTGGGADITGTEFADHLSMEDGTINALGGNDLCDGGLGGSTVQSVIDAGAGNDTIRTGEGADNLTGGKGNDSISAGDANDSINGGPGRDTIRAGLGDDFARGDTGNDRIYGEDGNDTVLGEGTTDTLYGGAGTDSFIVAENDKGFVKDFESGVDTFLITQ
jgi:Ca2+-binding RTX toxin-like protein